MKASDLRTFDPEEYLDSAEAIAAYLQEIFQDEDPADICKVLTSIARAKGMTEVARKSGLSRESLYNALSKEGNPELATVLKVIRALDLKIVTKIA